MTDLDKIIAILFPPLEKVIYEESEFYIDRSIDSNLMAVYEDYKSGVADQADMMSIQVAIKQLGLVRQLLGDRINQKVTESGPVLIAPLSIDE